MTEQERQKIKMAWAKGEEVQYLHDGIWKDWRHSNWLNLGDSLWREKPKTININGYEVPEPIRSLEEGDVIYSALAPWLTHTCYSKEGWRKELIAGTVHSTKEAAQLHYKALVSFTKVEE